MSIKIIQERLQSYHCRSAQAEEQALREITQEVVLAALARTGLYKTTAFHGGTCLRVFHGLNRFSEDLDFMLKKPDQHFNLKSYLKDIALEFEAYGYGLEVIDRSRAEDTVKKAFLKDDSIGKILQLTQLKADRSMRKIKIKLEVDSNPPGGSDFENQYLDFPFAFAVTTQDLRSLFAGKVHALLCREYAKGRDWYDFLWYAGRVIPVNFEFLSSALNQQGDWKDSGLQVNLDWCINKLEQKIHKLDWEAVAADIIRFIKPVEIPSIQLWSQEYFLNRLENYKRKLIK
ncbi:nucleotidyl transferase AbiEii/AbiGii toxin family protein [bacterium]|nr:nucleotidyl transferase AbiEii/AbiGii toxin family protein [bacterium]